MAKNLLTVVHNLTLGERRWIHWLYDNEGYERRGCRMDWDVTPNDIAFFDRGKVLNLIKAHYKKDNSCYFLLDLAEKLRKNVEP